MKVLARTRLRGFTLVELMVSLVAGLIVTIAVVGMARSATLSFYEQTRLSTVQATVRSGAERLRQDLARASFMSTGNIHLARNDSKSVAPGQKISHIPGAASPARYAALVNLQGIHIAVGGSATPTGAQGPNSLSTVNGLNPDMLEITGNFTTDDSYRGKLQGDTITLQVPIAPDYFGDVANSRLLVSGETSLRTAFCPGTANGTACPFIARVVDPRGCQHYAVISTVAMSGANGAIQLSAPLTGSPVLTPAQDESSCGANDQEEVSISPVQRVRWYIGPTNPVLSADTAVEPEPGNKFDLYREILDASTAAGGTVASPGGRQLVAEYAVDLKFGITVDDANPLLAPPANHRVFDMDLNPLDITDWTKAASSTTNTIPAAPALPYSGPAPQRVRSVRFRLATRAALPDRRSNITIIPTQPWYLSRYCVGAAMATCTNFARVRTIMSEVALTNQLGMTY
jgi:Tfp pilus assembly protein PilE